MPDRPLSDYVAVADRRLATARIAYRETGGLAYGDAFRQLAELAAGVWDAGIALTSAVMLIEGLSGLGRSTERVRFLKNDLAPRLPQGTVRGHLGNLSMLHNYQHNLSLSQSGFVTACHGAASLFRLLNELLPANRRLPADAYDWLRAVSF